MKSYYYDLISRKFRDQNGSASADLLSIIYGESPLWEFNLVDSVMQPADLSGIMAWRAVIKKNFLLDTTPMCAVENEEIEVEGNAVRIRTRSGTDNFFAEVVGKDRISAIFQLRGYNTDGDAMITLQCDIECRMSLDAIPVPVPVPDGLALQSWVEAVIARQIVVEFSADAELWHAELQPGVDVWQRFRHGANGEPSAAQLIPYGTNGISILWKGALASAPDDPELNWAYYNSTNRKAYVYDGSAWQILAQDGGDGRSILWKGEFASAPEDPELNWAYYNTTANKSYVYDGSQWDTMIQLPEDLGGGLDEDTVIGLILALS